MKFIIGLLCFVLAVVASAEEFSPLERPTAFDYHRRIGVPKAAEIKKWEEENAGSLDSQRIVGGWIADISQYPYQVRI